MAVRDYREMYIKTILTLGRERNKLLNRSDLAKLNFVELRELAQRLQS